MVYSPTVGLDLWVNMPYRYEKHIIFIIVIMIIIIGSIIVITIHNRYEHTHIYYIFPKQLICF